MTLPHFVYRHQLLPVVHRGDLGRRQSMQHAMMRLQAAASAAGTLLVRAAGEWLSAANIIF